MSIVEIILFVSSTSNESRPCIHFVSSTQSGIPIVRLDTAESRKKAMTGKYFQITSVPTLLVTRDSGDIQLFTSKEKIIAWLRQLFDSIKKQRTAATLQDTHKDAPSSSTPVDDDEEREEIVQKKGVDSGLYKGKKKTKSAKKSKSKNIDANPNPEPYTEVTEDDFDSEIIDPGVGSSSNLHFAKPNEPTKHDSTDVMSLARKMEMDRKQTLGYNDKE